MPRPPGAFYDAGSSEPRVSFRLFPTVWYALLVLLAGCGKKPVPPPPPVSVAGIMVRMNQPWLRILAARQKKVLDGLAPAVGELRQLGQDGKFRTGRNEEVWSRYVAAFDRGLDELATVRDPAQIEGAVRVLELSCKECHRRYR
ncbi:MAG: hypothetical protein ACE5H3_09430 [Planctomycetota bacterium]